MKVKRSSDGITITISDTRFSKLSVTLFAAFWNVLNLFISYGPLTTGSMIIVFVVVIPFSIMGFSLIYWSVLQWFNKTYIFAKDDVITVDYKPIPYPWFSNKIVKRDKLEKLYIKEQVYIREKVNHNKTTRTYTYDFLALMKSGADKKLLTFSSKDVVFSIKETLEKNLDIEIKFIAHSE